MFWVCFSLCFWCDLLGVVVGVKLILLMFTK